MAGGFLYTPRTRFFVRVVLPGIVAFLLFSMLILGFLIPGFERAMMERKQETTRELTRSAWSILEHYHRLEASGQLPVEVAREQARNAIKELRYGDEGKDYFWITDRFPRMVTHPYRPELDGQDLTEFRDPDGKALFVEFVKVTNRSGDGFVEYRWQWKDDSLRIVPKLSYVRLFEPWGWIVGTGIYVEDVKAEISRLEVTALLISGGIGLLIILLLIIITGQSHRIEIRRRNAEQQLARSHERYKALAEAATEGVLIWSDQGLHANRTLLSWLGLSEEELNTTSLQTIIPDKRLGLYHQPQDLFNELTSRMFVECDLMIRSGQSRAVHADFSRIHLAEQQAVMMVFRPLDTHEGLVGLSFSNELLNHSGTGFFRAALTTQLTLLATNQCMNDMLGLKTGQNAIGLSLEAWIKDSKVLKRIKSLVPESGPLIDLPIGISRQDGILFRGYLTAMVRGEIPGERFVEGSIERVGIEDVMPSINGPGITDSAVSYLASHGRIHSIQSLYDVTDAWELFPRNLLRSIDSAQEVDDLKGSYQKAVRLAGELISAGADAYRVARFISYAGDAICRKVLDLIINQSNIPQNGFALLQLGSAGRGEQSLATDQDNVFILDDSDQRAFNELKPVMLEIGGRLNQSLEQVGYLACKGGIMAGNPLWCLGLSEWKEKFARWTRSPGPNEILEMSIFFDFRHAAGDSSLTDQLHEFVSEELITNDIYFHHMAEAWQPFRPETRLAGMEQVSLKRLLMPLTGIVRLYSMKHGIRQYSTLSRAWDLFEGGVLTRQETDDIHTSWQFLMNQRLQSQYLKIIQGEQPDNEIRVAGMDPVAHYLLESSIRLIQDLLQKSASDFHVNERAL